MNMSTALQNHQADILNRYFNKSSEGLTVEAAKYFLSLQLDPTDESRLNELAEKARQGSLVEAEEREFDDYLRCMRLVDIVKLKSRLALQQSK